MVRTGNLGRHVLGNEVFFRTRHPEIVSPAVHHWHFVAEVPVSRRRVWRLPFEGGGFPGIVTCRTALEIAYNQIVDEQDLHQRHGDRRQRDGDVHVVYRL